jgi:hypothetical protein
MGVLFSLYGWVSADDELRSEGGLELGLAAAAKEKQAVKHASRVTPALHVDAIVTVSGCRSHATSAHQRFGDR